jgi:hypothetical protein
MLVALASRWLKREPDGSPARVQGQAQRHRHARPDSPDTSGPGEVPGDFEILYIALYDRLAPLARLTGADTAPAEDLVHDTFAPL